MILKLVMILLKKQRVGNRSDGIDDNMDVGYVDREQYSRTSIENVSQDS